MIKYISFLLIALLYIGCANNTNKQENENISSFAEYVDYKWRNINGQAISDDEKISKTNLFIKCYYYEDNDVCKKILENLEQECNNGVGLSCGLLSVASRDARGVSRDIDKTQAYINQGCYFNDSLSCLYIRHNYMQDGKYDIANKILKLVQNSCSKGSSFDCFLLSIIYENDDVFVKKNINIMQYRKKACEKDSALACAYMDSKQLGKKAYQQYQKKACDLGMLSACDALRESIDLNVFTQHSRLFRIW